MLSTSIENSEQRSSTSNYHTQAMRLRSTTSLLPPKHRRASHGSTESVMASEPKTRRNFDRCIARRVRRVLDPKLNDESCSVLMFFLPVITTLITARHNR